MCQIRRLATEPLFAAATGGSPCARLCPAVTHRDCDAPVRKSADAREGNGVKTTHIGPRRRLGVRLDRVGTLVPQYRASLIVLAVACSAPRGAEPSSAPLSKAPASATSAPASLPVDAQAPRAVPDAVAPPASASFSFRRVLDAPVHSLAFAENSYVAALGVDAWLDRGKGFKKLTQPPRPTGDVEIYFGRDNMPRLMGFVRTPAGETSVYNRWRKDAWDSGADEIGRLAGVPGPFYGVLGPADPEVVCKRGDQCIIKRRSGWTTLPALPNLPRVVLCDGQAWAFESSQLWFLEKAGWRQMSGAPAFTRIGSVWGASPADVWIVDAGRNVLHHLSGSTWTEQRLAVDGPRAVWAPSPSEIWLVGEGGAARHDGKEWTLAADAPKGAAVVTGRSTNEVWLAGSSGVWRGNRTPP